VYCENSKDGMSIDTDSLDAGPVGLASRRRRPRQLSQLFSRLASEAGERVTIASILDALGDRSFAALLVLFAAVNLIPLPPGASFILGLPLLIVAAQLTYGARRAWLPQFIAEKSVSAEQFSAIMDRVVPRLVQMERLIRPRYWPFWRRRGDRVIGFMALLLSVILVLPIPFGNWLPALAIALLGLALFERDGLLFGIGSVVAAASALVVVLVVGTVAAATQAMLGWLF